jgi:signal transduction histidine kinase
MPPSATESLVVAPPAVSAGSNVIEFPVRDGYVGRDSLLDVVFALATAEDLGSAVARLAEWLRRGTGVSRVELWSIGSDGGFELVAEAGTPRGRRHNVPLGPAAVLVLHGERFDPTVESALSTLTPILRRLAADEQLTRTAMQLARRNEALEDFAALVAHELKTPLHAALVAEDPFGPVEDALALVETVLQAAHDEPGGHALASVAEVLEQAVEDLRAEVAIDTELATTLPLPPEPLRVILRNLLSNAVAAGAHSVHVTAERSSSSSYRLLVDDDGRGLLDVDRYASGSGLGLSLIRRIASRFGGRLELAPHPSGGTRATLEFVEASQ